MDKQPESVAEMLQRTLHISGALAERLVEAGISSLDELAYIPLSELRELGGLWDEELTALRSKARDHLLNEAVQAEQRIMEEAPQNLLGDESPDKY